MSAPGELWVVVAYQPQPGFMDQGCGLQRISRGFVRHFGGGKLTQLLIDQRQQFICGFGVAALDSLDHPGDVAHVATCYQVLRGRASQIGTIGLPGQHMPALTPIFLPPIFLSKLFP